MARYEIVVLDQGTWTPDTLGEPNQFETIDDAWKAVDELRTLGDDWAAATYDVRERN